MKIHFLPSMLLASSLWQSAAAAGSIQEDESIFTNKLNKNVRRDPVAIQKARDERRRELSNTRFDGTKTKKTKGKNVLVRSYRADGTEITKTKTKTKTINAELREATAHQHADPDPTLVYLDNDIHVNIVGGTTASLANYPYFVDLNGCGGSLLGPRIVLTAAHCGNYLGRDIEVNGEFRRVIKQQKHPSYSSNSDANDFKLLRLDSDILIDSSISLTLPDSNYNMRVGDPLTVIGYGAVREGGFQSVALREVEVNYVDNDECNERDRYDGGVTDYNMFCAGVEGGGKDSCQGDSGGPLVVVSGNTHIQTGVTSWGNGCAREQFPGVYARVSYARDWIEDQVCNRWNVEAEFCPGGIPNPTPAPQPAPTPAPQATPTPAPQSAPTGGNGNSNTENAETFDVGFRLKTDRWPEENDFFLADSQGNFVLNEWGFNRRQLYSYDETLDSSKCYTLNFYDSYGDGLVGNAYLEVLINGVSQVTLGEEVGDGVIFSLGDC